MIELVRCRPCGYVIRADKLGDVCPACGLPRKVFEPYREKVSANRKMILGFDLHPIAIHLSQTFVGLIPLLMLVSVLFKDFHPVIIQSVIVFGVYVLPFSLILALVTGIVDGITRFKSLKPPLLRFKLIVSGIITSISFVILFLYKSGEFSPLVFILNIACLGCAVALGLWGKKLIEVILPGTYPQKKGSKNKNDETAKKNEE